MTGYVFEKDPFWAAFADDAGDLWPEVTGVVCTTAFACCTEGLAGISGEDDVECPAEDSGIEAAEIIPDGCRGEIPRGLCGDEDNAGPVLPFDNCAGVITGFGQHEAHIQASAACAEGQSVKGT